MIPASVRIRKGEVIDNLALTADQKCYTGAVIEGIVTGDVTVVKVGGYGDWFPSNVHVYLGKDGIVKGNIAADYVIIRGQVLGNVDATQVYLLPEGKVRGKITSVGQIKTRFELPSFLKEFNECTDNTVLAFKKLEEKLLN